VDGKHNTIRDCCMNSASSLYKSEMRQSYTVAEVTTVVLGAGDLQYILKPLVRNTSVNRFCYEVRSSSGVPRNFVLGRVQQIQLRTEDRENGDLGAVAP